MHDIEVITGINWRGEKRKPISPDLEIVIRRFHLLCPQFLYSLEVTNLF